MRFSLDAAALERGFFFEGKLVCCEEIPHYYNLGQEGVPAGK